MFIIKQQINKAQDKCLFISDSAQIGNFQLAAKQLKSWSRIVLSTGKCHTIPSIAQSMQERIKTQINVKNISQA